MWSCYVIASQAYERIVRDLEDRGHKLWAAASERKVRGKDRPWPMVPYLFILEPFDARALERERGIHRPLRDATGERVRVTEDHIVRMQLAAGKYRKASAKGLSRGDRVRIRAGALAEIAGILEEATGGVAIVKVDLLGKGRNIRVATSALEVA